MRSSRKHYQERSLQKVQGHRATVDDLAPPTEATAGGDVPTNKRASARNDATPR